MTKDSMACLSSLVTNWFTASPKGAWGRILRDWAARKEETRASTFCGWEGLCVASGRTALGVLPVVVSQGKMGEAGTYGLGLFCGRSIRRR